MEGYTKVKDFDFASGSTFSTAVNIAGYHKVAFQVPAFTACLATESACVYVNVANAPTDTFYRVRAMGVYSAASGIYDWEVPQGVGNFVAVCPPAEGFAWMKLETARGATFNATCTAGMDCKVFLGR